MRLFLIFALGNFLKENRVYRMEDVCYKFNVLWNNFILAQSSHEVQY